MRYKKPFTLVKRALEKKNGKPRIVYYYRLADDPKMVLRSTGESLMHRAEQYVKEEVLEKCGVPLFKDYAKYFFDPEKGTYYKRQLRKKRSMSIPVALSCQGHLNKYLIPQFSKKLISDINAVEFENWQVNLPLANKTKNHILYTMRIDMLEARWQRLIRQNHIEMVDLMGTDHRHRDVLTMEELKKLFPASREEFCRIWYTPMYGVMYALMASGGLRPQ